MRVLIIEDYALLRKSLSQGFREQGYAVDESGDGEEGLWFAESNDYDLIVLDLMLPGIDGLTILQSLRDQDRDMPILILSAKDTVEDRVKGLDIGADDYLIKPFAFEELLARARTLIRRHYSKNNQALRAGALRIDPAAKLVYWGDRSMALTPREFALLEYLTLRQGEVVSRSEIWDHVYDFQAKNTSNVVDVYVRRLRSKLETLGCSGLIQTRRGMGYSLVKPQEKEWTCPHAQNRASRPIC